MKKYKQYKQKGFLLLGILIFTSVCVLIVTAFVSWGVTTNKLARRVQNRETALQIAEAGIEYARWYLAHYQTGYTLGNTGAAPYVYDFNDKNGVKVGTYSLTVTPPPAGSTIVKIKSTGKTVVDPTISRSIVVNLAIPSFAKYAVVANADMRFGEGTIIYGPLHSNGGIRFDGEAYNKVSSAKASYDDPDHSGGKEFGVHTHVTSGGSVNDTFRSAEAPPSAVPTRLDVFKAGREFPVPAVDFSAITADLATIKSQAQASGRYIAASNASGYQIILKTNDTFDLYKVTSVMNVSNSCTNPNNQTGWGTWTVNNRQFVANYAFPANGLIFVEDHVWVEGQINTARLVIAAAKFPDNVSTRKNILITSDIKYTNYDGTDVLGLIAQNDVTVGMNSDTDLKIDAALVAQNGRIGRFYYECFPYSTRDTITLTGILATNQRYGFGYTDGTGYQTRIINYDTNLLYSPPPYFPLASDKYQIISWEELEN